MEEFDSAFPSQVIPGKTIKGLAFQSPAWKGNQPEGHQFLILPEGEFDHGLEGYSQKEVIEVGGQAAEKWETDQEEVPGFSSIIFFPDHQPFRVEFLSTKKREEAKMILEEILATFNFEAGR